MRLCGCPGPINGFCNKIAFLVIYLKPCYCNASHSNFHLKKKKFVGFSKKKERKKERKMRALTSLRKYIISSIDATLA